MGYSLKKWKERIKNRTDICQQVVHLTRGNTIGNKNYSAMDILIKILRERTILGSTTASGFIVGSTEAVCFQAAPLYSVCQNIDFESKIRNDTKSNKIRYAPFGLAFRKEYVYKTGARPVIYDETSKAKSYLPRNEWWRIVNFDLSDNENLVDWTHEREWRKPNNFEFDIQEATVLVPNSKTFKLFYKKGREKGEDITQQVRCVLSLGSLYL